MEYWKKDLYRIPDTQGPSEKALIRPSGFSKPVSQFQPITLFEPEASTPGIGELAFSPF